MAFQPGFDAAKQQCARFWSLENHDLPLLCICAPRDGAAGKLVQVIATPEELEFMLQSLPRRG